MTTTSEIRSLCHIHGVRISYAGAFQIASNRRHGADTETQLATQSLLEDPELAISFKQSFYAGIAADFTAHLEYGSVGILKSEGYTQSIADERQMPDQQLRRFVRAMRADLLSRPKSEDHEYVFRQCIDKLASDLDRLQPSWRPSTMMGILNEHGGDMYIFYEQLYAQSGSRRNIGMWTPYEAPLLHHLYTAGDTKQTLSEFDMLSLQPHAIRPRRYRGVPCDDHVILAHRGVLLHNYPRLLPSDCAGTIYGQNLAR